MTQLTIDDAMARYPEGPGFKTNGTSREAAEKIASTTEQARARIRKLLWQSQPMSADQIAAELGWTVLYTRPRVAELHKMGAIRKAGRVKNASGMTANLWTVA